MLGLDQMKQTVNNEMQEESIKSKIKLETELLYNPLVADYLKSNFGNNAVKIISAAMEEMTDDAIAARCKLKVAEVRAVLNKLYNYRFAEYKRIKDRDTGWFSYLWKIDVLNVLDMIKKETSERISELEKQVEKMNTELLYYCPQCSKTNVISFDLASDLLFRCPSCENKLLEKEYESKDKCQEELHELKSKHFSLLNDIKRFEDIKRQEEIRIKELQEKFAEITRIEELSKVRRSNKTKKPKLKSLKSKSISNKKFKVSKHNKTTKAFKAKNKKIKPIKPNKKSKGKGKVKLFSTKPKQKLKKLVKSKNKRKNNNKKDNKHKRDNKNNKKIIKIIKR